MFGKFIADENGATAIEYGLIVTLLSIAIISTTVALSDTINGVLAQIAAML